MGNSSLVDVVDVNKVDDVKGLIKDLQEATAQPPRAPAPAEPAAPKAQERPKYIEEKYWNGDLESSLEAQYKGLKSLQSSYGQMANDLGVQRKLTDELIGVKRHTDLRGQDTQAPEPKPLPKLTASALLERPDAAMDEYLSAREAKRMQAYEEKISRLEQQLTGLTLQSQHSDYADLLQDPDWQEFLNDPERAHLAAYAAQGDTIIANRLIKEYKATKAPKPANTQPVAQERPAPKGDNLTAAAAAALETAASGESGQGKLYSRTALMMLKARNPEVYEEPRFQEEILKAYQEKRVR